MSAPAAGGGSGGALRPGVFRFIWRNFVDSLSRKRFEKTFVGTDAEGNRYFEMRHSKKVVNRGFIPAKNSSEVPPPEWMTWLRGLRKYPPTEDEVAAIRQASQEMAIKVKELIKEEKNNGKHFGKHEEMPHVVSTTTMDDFESQPRSFPRYADYDKEQPKMT